MHVLSHSGPEQQLLDFHIPCTSHLSCSIREIHKLRKVENNILCISTKVPEFTTSRLCDFCRTTQLEQQYFDDFSCSLMSKFSTPKFDCSKYKAAHGMLTRLSEEQLMSHIMIPTYSHTNSNWHHWWSNS
jgi:hypothetical protein